LLHPDGHGGSVLVFGDGERPAWATEDGDRRAAKADIVVLVPSDAERRSRSWAREAAGVASGLAPDGLVIAPEPSGSLGRELSAVGLSREVTLTHVPDLTRSRYVFPARGGAAAYALKQVVPMHPVKRAAGRALPLTSLMRSVAATSVYRRAGGRPLLGWLAALDPARRSCTAIVMRSWRPEGATVLQRFAGGALPDVVAKVGAGAAREAAAIRALGDGAAAAAVDVPRLVGETALGAAPVMVVKPIFGASAADALRGSARSVDELLPAVAEWLAAWNSRTSVRRPFERADAEEAVLEPARILAPELSGGGAYLARLHDLCAEVEGAEVPFVAAHNDLTAANILVSPDRRLGILDWESAVASRLPLSDLVYAAGDFAAAVGFYRDRPGAFASCFEANGRFAPAVSEILDAARAALAVSAPVAELSIHACWLHHAANERAQAAAGRISDRPFLDILQRVAAGATR
jgi:hypothetical protein